MADLTYTVDVNTNPAQKSLDALNKKVETVNKTFNAFKQALIGFATGGFIAQAYQYADAISDLSDATNIAIEAVVGFGKAVQQSGGDAEKANQGLLKFVQSIGEAADGSLKTQNAFQDVGISLKDLATLSEQDLLRKAIDGLAKIDDTAKRSVVQLELFGKAMKGVSAQNLAEAFGPATDASGKYAQSIKAAADAQQNLEVFAGDFKIALLETLQPISELAKNLLAAGSASKDFIKTGLDIGLVVIEFLAVGKAIRLVTSAFKALAAAPAVIKGGFDILARTWDAFKVQLGFVRKEGAITQATFEGLSKRFQWLGKGLDEIMQGLAVLGGAFTAFYKLVLPEGMREKIEGFFGKLKEYITGTSSGAGAGRGGNEELTKQLQEQGEKLRKQSEAAREVQDALAKRRKEIEQTTVAFGKQNQEIAQGIQLETSLVGKSEDYAEVVRAVAEINKRANDEVEKLRLAKSLLTKDEQALAATYDQQIKKILEVAAADEKRIVSAIQGLQSAKLLEQDRLNTIELINQQLQKQATYDESILQIRRQAQEALDQAKFEGAQMQRTPLEQKIEEIKRNAEKAALEAGRSFSQQFEGLELSAQDAKKLADGLDLIAQKYKEIADQQTKNLEASRSFATGWKTAFDEYMDNATNAAKRAGEIFNRVTSNMESAIDKFVETGKFSFSDFARSVIQDLLKIELKAQATQLLKGLQSGAGSFLGSIFGFAEGGNPPINKPSIVGENGPELFVPKTAGTVIPNNELSGKSTTPTQTNIVYNINAIDSKSVAEFFASNRKTMLGTIQLAQKELPYGNR